MKTFIVLFVIAVSLPTEAQRVKENIRQRPGITAPQSQVVDSHPDVKTKNQNHDTRRKR